MPSMGQGGARLPVRPGPRSAGPGGPQTSCPCRRPSPRGPDAPCRQLMGAPPHRAPTVRAQGDDRAAGRRKRRRKRRSFRNIQFHLQHFNTISKDPYRKDKISVAFAGFGQRLSNQQVQLLVTRICLTNLPSPVRFIRRSRRDAPVGQALASPPQLASGASNRLV